jgi:hypothetical protein
MAPSFAGWKRASFQCNPLRSDDRRRLGMSQEILLRESDMSIERITHSAARVGDRIWSLPAPNRHHHVFRVMQSEGFTAWGTEDTGFLTDTGRYVDRAEGAALALASGQVEKLYAPPDLYSEDLW